MNKEYNQLTLDERKQIQAGLDRGDSFRRIAGLIGRQPSTVSREVRENCIARTSRGRLAACREAPWCDRSGVCADCVREGARCAGCDARDCRAACPAYALQSSCPRMSKAPWVCNGCGKNRYGCNRPGRRSYDADAAQKASDFRRSDSRGGPDITPERAAVVFPLLGDALRRGLSPYEISQLYADEVGVSPSTIYRWVDAGYGGLTSLDLERKVGFKPRKKKGPRKSTPHSRKRSHDAFEELPGNRKDSRTELDSVIGRNADKQAVLTVYNLPCHVQLGLLVKAHDCESAKGALRGLKSAMPPEMFDRWMATALTDNGDEFSDEDGIGALLGEEARGGELALRLYYCDPRQSQQKGGCEKNHTEIRQVLEKGMFVFDELVPADMAVLMSHVNSNPRESLAGKSPLQMLRFAYGDESAQALMDALGIREVGRDELVLKPEILDIERAKRGEPPLTRLK